MVRSRLLTRSGWLASRQESLFLTCDVIRHDENVPVLAPPCIVFQRIIDLAPKPPTAAMKEAQEWDGSYLALGR